MLRTSAPNHGERMDRGGRGTARTRIAAGPERENWTWLSEARGPRPRSHELRHRPRPGLKLVVLRSWRPIRSDTDRTECQAGEMLGLSRKRFAGSYFAFSSRRRWWLEP